MDEASKNPHIANFLKQHHVGVLATANKDNAMPHAAVVFYATDSHLNIYFLTKKQTSKSRNLQVNPWAAFTVYEEDTQRTAQIQGMVSEVLASDMMERAKPLFAKFSKQSSGSEDTPISKLNSGDYVLYCLAPQSIRLAEYRYGVKNDMFDVATPAEESLD